jgi:hypothetical protein
MGLIILIVILVLVFGGGGGYYAHSNYGYVGSGGVLSTVLVIVLVIWLLNRI